MKQRNTDEVVEMYKTMSDKIYRLNNMLDNMLNAGLVDSSEYKKVSNEFYMTCGATQALQWVLELRSEIITR